MKTGNKKILVIGASADLSTTLNKMLCKSGVVLGLHYNKNGRALSKYKEGEKLKKFKKNLNSSKSCYDIIDDFVNWAGGIDYLVQMSGSIKRPVLWRNLQEEDWYCDLSNNMIMPFFLAQRAVCHMKAKGGRIVLMSTSSASHGGGAMSLAYGVAKAGVECIVKRLAKDCGRDNILVNAIAPGFILTKFHTEKMNKTQRQLRERIKSIPMKRAGTTKEVAELIMFLLSEGASYITGQTIAVCGGDWV